MEIHFLLIPLSLFLPPPTVCVFVRTVFHTVCMCENVYPPTRPTTHPQKTLCCELAFFVFLFFCFLSGCFLCASSVIVYSFIQRQRGFLFLKFFKFFKKKRWKRGIHGYSSLGLFFKGLKKKIFKNNVWLLIMEVVHQRLHNTLRQFCIPK